MRQFTFVEVHECGHLRRLRPHRAATTGAAAPMALMNTRTLQTSRWYWRCTRCQHPVTSSVVPRLLRPAAAAACEWTGSRSTAAYYPQKITVLNPPTRNEYTQLAHEHVHAAAVAQALGDPPAGHRRLRQAGSASADDVDRAVQGDDACGRLEPGDPLYDAGLAKAQARGRVGASVARRRRRTRAGRQKRSRPSARNAGSCRWSRGAAAD